MEALLIRERYKVISVLYAEQDYAALQAVDIQDREKTTCLLNVYEGDLLKPYLRCFYELRNCSDYQEMFVWENHLVTVFSYREGMTIDQVFYRGAPLDWQLRLAVAQTLFHQALATWDYPPEISCAALLSENIQILQDEQLMAVNYAVRPLGELDRRELLLLLADQVKKVLIERWDSPLEERQFVRELCRGAETSAVAVYGKWAAAEPVIREAYEKIEQKPTLSRGLYLVFLNAKDWFKQRTAKRKEQKGGRAQ